MPDPIHRLALRLRLFLTPGTGRHRRTRHQPHPVPVLGPVAAPACPPVRLPRHRSPYGLPTPLDGTASRLVRPYLLAHGQGAAFSRHRRTLVLTAECGVALDRHRAGAPEAAAA